MKLARLVLDLDRQWELLEEYSKLKEEDQIPWLFAKHKCGEIEILGITDKTAPELATEFIKLGIKAKSFVKGKKDGK